MISGSLQKTAETAECAARGWDVACCVRRAPVIGMGVPHPGSRKGSGAQKGGLEGPGAPGRVILGLCRKQQKQQSPLREVPSDVYFGC